MFKNILKQSPIGLDLGASTLRMLQLGIRQGHIVALAAAARPLPVELPTGQGQRSQAVGKIIREMLDESGFSGRNVVSCMTAGTVRYKNLRMPRMPAEEMQTAIEWEAVDHLKLGERQNLRLQYFDSGEVRQGDELRQEIILLAATMADVNQHMEMLKECGLNPQAIDAVPGALARWAQAALRNEDPSEPVFVIDVGMAFTKVLLVRDDRVLFFKLIELGGPKFDQVVAKSLNLPIADAATLRRSTADGAQNGAPATSTDRAVADAVRAVALELAHEVALCLRYCSVTFRGRRPEKVHLVGGESSEPQLVRALIDDVGVLVHKARPFDSVDYSLVEALRTGSIDLSDWAVAVGLALRDWPGAVLWPHYGKPADNNISAPVTSQTKEVAA